MFHFGFSPSNISFSFNKAIDDKKNEKSILESDLQNLFNDTIQNASPVSQKNLYPAPIRPVIEEKKSFDKTASEISISESTPSQTPSLDKASEIAFRFPFFVTVEDEERIKRHVSLKPLVEEFHELQKKCLDCLEKPEVTKEMISKFQEKFNDFASAKHPQLRRKILEALFVFRRNVFCLLPPKCPSIDKEIREKYPEQHSRFDAVDIKIKNVLSIFDKIYANNKVPRSLVEELNDGIEKLFEYALYFRREYDDAFFMYFNNEHIPQLRNSWKYLNLKTQLEVMHHNIKFPNKKDFATKEDGMNVRQFFLAMEAHINMLLRVQVSSNRWRREDSYKNIVKNMGFLRMALETFPKGDPAIAKCEQTMLEINNFVEAHKLKYQYIG